MPLYYVIAADQTNCLSQLPNVRLDFACVVACVVPHLTWLLTGATVAARRAGHRPAGGTQSSSHGPLDGDRVAGVRGGPDWWD